MQQSTNKSAPSQLEQALEKLVAMKQDITAQDRDDARNTGFSEFTIVQYLAGRGKNLDTAMKLIEFFGGKIQERAVILGQS